jgi:hypothetical protein
MDTSNTSCLRVDLQAIATAAAEGECCGSATADAAIVAEVGATFNTQAQCQVFVQATTVGDAVAHAIGSGGASAVRSACLSEDGHRPA